MLVYAAIKASYTSIPLMASPTISEIAVAKIILATFPTLVFSLLMKAFIKTYSIEAIKNFVSAVPPKNMVVVIEISTHGMISGTPAEFIAANIAIPNGIAPDANFKLLTKIEIMNTIIFLKLPINVSKSKEIFFSTTSPSFKSSNLNLLFKLSFKHNTS